jgi:hypothetical protein
MGSVGSGVTPCPTLTKQASNTPRPRPGAGFWRPSLKRDTAGYLVFRVSSHLHPVVKHPNAHVHLHPVVKHPMHRGRPIVAEQSRTFAYVCDTIYTIGGCPSSSTRGAPPIVEQL